MASDSTILGVASTTNYGLTRQATDAEVSAGSSGDAVTFTTPAQLNASSSTLSTAIDNLDKVSKYILNMPKKWLTAPNGTTLSIAANTVLSMKDAGGSIQTTYWDSDFTFAPASNLDTGSALSAGKDYTVYYVPTKANKIVVSLNATTPSGYTAAQVMKVGGFHTICANVGTIAGHPLSGYVAGNILPNSTWCTTHRPASCDPAGMAYVEPMNGWCDIYLQSGTGLGTASKYGLTITDTQIYAAHEEDMFCVGKRLINDIEFSCAMEGSNQQTNINGSADPVTTGGHIDTAGRRMISIFGIEDGCGVLWQWIGDGVSANGGSGWNAQAGGKGSIYGSCMALLAGGNWGNGASCGSRCRAGSASRLHVDTYFSARGWAENI